MKPTKKWQSSQRKDEDILVHLLVDRGYASPAAQENFLNPPPPKEILNDARATGIDDEDFNQVSALIRKVIALNQPIVIHGDYDVDGICATGILWKTIYQDLNYKNCRPFIPNRFDHGYGLSRSSVDSISNLGDLGHLKPLLITVDCGVTAANEVEYAKEKGFDVLVIDHHAKPLKLPDCQILWTEKMCAAGLSWSLVSKLQVTNSSKYLDLAALGTIADLQPLTGYNRSLVKFGLEELNRTKNIGLRALIKAGGIEGKKIGPFEVGWVLAPRINAAGRLEDALSSLRLLCTNDENQAIEIARDLNEVNARRQELTKEMVELAKEQLTIDNGQLTKIAVVTHEEFHEGIIGLVAGKLTQLYGVPAVVISQGLEFSKASARSVAGFNIVEFLRSLGDHFENIGGHAGAAGFTILTSKIESFRSMVNGQMSKITLPEVELKIDAEVKFQEINFELLEKIKRLEPFGLANPEPVFLLKNAQVVEARTVGSQGAHLKLKCQMLNVNGQMFANPIDCIGFGLGESIKEVGAGEKVDLVFYLAEDTFNGNQKLSLKLKDFRRS